MSLTGCSTAKPPSRGSFNHPFYKYPLSSCHKPQKPCPCLVLAFSCHALPQIVAGLPLPISSQPQLPHQQSTKINQHTSNSQKCTLATLRPRAFFFFRLLLHDPFQRYPLLALCGNTGASVIERAKKAQLARIKNAAQAVEHVRHTVKKSVGAGLL